MIEIIINGREGLRDIIERLDAMPMTRKHGKGLVARIPVKNTDQPSALYIRVSSSQQAEQGKGSLPEQFHATWEETEQRNGTITTVYADVCTAANRNRWAFNVLLDDLSEGKIEMIGCWHSSRLVRTQLAAGELEEAIEKLGRPVKMFAVTDTLDADILGILAWAGRWERKAFRERSLMGRQAAVADNRPPSGNPPFWIEIVRDEEGKPAGFTLKPVSKWIKWAAEAYADGTGSTEIVRRLNAEGIPRATGRTKYGWTRQYLIQILKYPALKGKWGPFWGEYVGVPSLIDAETWDRIQEKMKENGSHTGRPAKHFVALRGLLWCGVCGQKMGTHVRDWDYTYKRLADGTKARYRIKKQKLKIRYVCGGQQHYGFKCRKPEYVRDKVLFPRVWGKLCEALSNRDVLLAGLESRLHELENSDELEELRRIDKRLDQLHQRELSYAEQRADNSITKAVHRELMLRLNEERKEVLQAQAQLEQKATLIEQARQQANAAHTLIEALPGILPDISRVEQEKLIMALIARVDVDGDNQVTIHLRLDPEVINALPQPRGLPASSRQPESGPSNGSPSEELGTSRASPAHDPSLRKGNAGGYTRSMDCRPY